MRVNATGRLDLMSLVNASVVIGNVMATPSSVITGADFSITSANITIDNATYGV